MAAFDDRNDEDEDDLFDEAESQNDKYITFNLGEEIYAINIKFVREIIGIQKITHVPDMPNFIKGVLNLRGSVIPIIDVRIRFGMPTVEYNERTCIIVVTIEDSEIGLIVDEVAEVLDIPLNHMDSTPKTNKKAKNKYIQGIGKVGDNVIIVLGVANILSEEEFSEIANIA